jgi:hypothetical protein
MANLPWKGIELVGTQIPSDRVLGFKMLTVSGLSCGNVTVLDAANRHLTNLDLSKAVPGEEVQVEVEKDRDFAVSCSESIKKEGKTTKIGGKEYKKVEVEGKILVSNGKKGFAEINIRRDLEGTVLDAGKGNVTDGKTTIEKSITWKQTVGGGEKKELFYRYEALLPQ